MKCTVIYLALSYRQLMNQLKVQFEQNPFVQLFYIYLYIGPKKFCGSEQRHHPSPFAALKSESRTNSSRTPPRFRSSIESFKSSIKARFSRNRSISAPKLRPQDKGHPVRAPAFPGSNPVSTYNPEKEVADNIEEDSHAENCSQEINELIANGKLANSRYNFPFSHLTCEVV